MADEAMISAQPEADVLEVAVREHSRLVYRIAYSVLRNAAEAEDAVQEVFLRALRYGKKLTGVEDQKAWLAQIAWRTAVEQRRRGAKDGAQSKDGSQSEDAADREAMFSGDLGAERILLDKERGELLAQLITRLPDALRDPLVLLAMEELSPREIGAMLGISEAAVRSRAFRARQILRERMTARMGQGRELDPTKREHEIEQCLDLAISQYGKAEPRSGLESRVLAGLQAERSRITSRRHWWWAGGAITAAVAIVALAWAGANGRTKNPGVVARTSMPSRHEEAQRSIEPVRAQQAVHPAKEVAHRRPANQPSCETPVAATPKLDQFPSRRRMSEGELLLARRLSEQTNTEALFESTPSDWDVDLSVGSLEIRPLQIPDIEISENKTN